MMGHNEIVAFFTDVYFVAPLEKQNRLVSIANGGVSGNTIYRPIWNRLLSLYWMIVW